MRRGAARDARSLVVNGSLQAPSRVEKRTPAKFCEEKLRANASALRSTHACGRTPPAIPPLSLNLSSRRALPRHLLKLNDPRSSSVPHRTRVAKRSAWRVGVQQAIFDPQPLSLARILNPSAPRLHRR